MRPTAFRSPAARLLLAVVAVLFGTHPLRAQLSVSDTVRLRLRDAEPVLVAGAPSDVRGVVIRRDSAVLVVRRLERGDTVRVLQSTIVDAELLRGTRRRGWAAIGWGVLIGAGVGATTLLAARDRNPPGNDFRFTAPTKGAIGGVMGGIGGLVVGGIVALTKTDNWIPVEASRLFAHVELVPRGAGIALAWRRAR